MNSFTDRRTLAPICASLLLLLCTFNLSCSSSPCAPVFHAVEKLKSTDFHAFASAWESDGTETTTEGVVLNGTVYFKKNNDKWSINESSADGIDQFLKNNVKTAANISCHLDGSKFTDGESADYYVTEGRWEGLNIHGRFWVSESSGLLLRVSFKMDAGERTTGIVSMRYEYTNVTAPVASQ